MNIFTLHHPLICNIFDRQSYRLRAYLLACSMTCHFITYLEGHRYALSVILSFLNEVDGTCLLITNTTWYKRILPIFEIPPDLVQVVTGDVVQEEDQSHDDGSNSSDNHANQNECIHGNHNLPRRRKRIRHRFIPMPIQCPWVLLDRLNCIRLKRRMQYLKKSQTAVVERDNLQPTNDKHSFLILPYPTDMTTEEIAWYEWTRDRRHFVMVQEHHRQIKIQQQNAQDDTLELESKFSLSLLPTMPTKYELLRYRSPPTPTTNTSSSSLWPENKDLKSPPPEAFFNTYLRPSLTSPLQEDVLSMPPKILTGVTLLASYPRSGNTLLRTLLESVTGILTGSDTRPDRTLSKALSTLHSLVGEGITSQSKACVIKTHFPERRGYMMYNAKRVILLVRNPFDAIDSYWNMCCTNTHTESVSENVYERYRDKFRGLALNEIGTWADFLIYWLLNCDTTLRNESANGCDGGSVGPRVLVVRFEDLVQNTEMVMQQVLHFMTVECPSTHTPLHPFWKWRIKRALNLEWHDDFSNNDDTGRHHGHDNKIQPWSPPSKVDTSKLGSYEPRSMNQQEEDCSKRKPTSFGKSLIKGRYSTEDLVHMHQTVADKVLYQSCGKRVNLLQLFGYDVFQQGFPKNFDERRMKEDWSFLYPDKTTLHSVIRVNQGVELRPIGSPYGRAMTKWRKSQTCDDTKPFE